MITAVLELQENGKLQEMPSSNNVNSNNQSGNFTVPNDNGRIIGWPLYIIFQVIFVLLYNFRCIIAIIISGLVLLTFYFFQIVGLLLILFVFLWLQIFRGGYDISDTRKICNWHPLLMTIAFVFLFANCKNCCMQTFYIDIRTKRNITF